LNHGYSLLKKAREKKRGRNVTEVNKSVGEVVVGTARDSKRKVHFGIVLTKYSKTLT